MEFIRLQPDLKAEWFILNVGRNAACAEEKMARRSGTRKSSAEEWVGCIYGIDRKKAVVLDIWVYKKGSSVRLSGPISHSVHWSNAANSDGWRQEAAIVWELTDTIFIPGLLLNAPETKEQVERLKLKAVEMGKQ
jgi:hypothetical protein